MPQQRKAKAEGDRRKNSLFNLANYRLSLGFVVVCACRWILIDFTVFQKDRYCRPNSLYLGDFKSWKSPMPCILECTNYLVLDEPPFDRPREDIVVLEVILFCCFLGNAWKMRIPHWRGKVQVLLGSLDMEYGG
jgi:hypothetical protein